MNIDMKDYESKYSHRFPDFLTFHQVEVETNSGALAGGFGLSVTLQGIHPRFFSTFIRRDYRIYIIYIYIILYIYTIYIYYIYDNYK